MTSPRMPFAANPNFAGSCGGAAAVTPGDGTADAPGPDGLTVGDAFGAGVATAVPGDVLGVVRDAVGRSDAAGRSDAVAAEGATEGTAATGGRLASIGPGARAVGAMSAATPAPTRSAASPSGTRTTSERVPGARIGRASIRPGVCDVR